jgi:hypothetical protein
VTATSTAERGSLPLTRASIPPRLGLIIRTGNLLRLSRGHRSEGAPAIGPDKCRQPMFSIAKLRGSRFQRRQHNIRSRISAIEQRLSALGAISAGTRAPHYGRESRQVITLSATGQLGMSATGQIQLTVVIRAEQVVPDTASGSWSGSDVGRRQLANTISAARAGWRTPAHLPGRQSLCQLRR